MISSLLFLSQIKRGRRIAVLGDMLELGDRSDAFHHATGRFAATHADLLFFFGNYAEVYASGASAGGAHPLCPSKSSPFFAVLPPDKAEAAAFIATHIQKNDNILFKASRALKAEELIDRLKEALL
jgi:UDP-N-acetylmuramoyl-tripeptide--D-alanyl-D-alanine ligase